MVLHMAVVSILVQFPQYHLATQVDITPRYEQNLIKPCIKL